MKKITILLIALISINFSQSQDDGTIDSSFLINNDGQKGVNGVVWAIAEQTDGKLIIGGGFDTYNQVFSPKLVRVNPDGSVDNTFNQTLLRDTNPNITSIVIQPDGKILVAGNFEMRTAFPDNDLLEEDIMRLNPDGTRDTSFIAPENTSGCGDIQQIALQPDGKIILVGDISFCTNDTIDNNENILRLNENGSLDETFNPVVTHAGFGFSEEPINSVEVQSDGKIIIGGDFNEVNGIAQLRLARLNTDGTLDTSYAVGSGFNEVINDIKLQSDGKLLVVGDFTEYNGVALNQMVRLNTDGSLDNSFNSGDGVGRFQPSNSFTAPRNIEHVNIQADGKILIGGDYNRYNGNPVSRYTRLNTNGTLDTSFLNVDDEGIEIAHVYTSLITSTGDFLIGGNIDKHNRYRKSGIVKLTSAGQVDLSFNSGNGPTEGYFDTKINTITKGTGDKLYVCGRFREYDDIFSRNFARINTDGALDNSFSVGTDELIAGFDDEVYDALELVNGKVIVVGDFGNYNGNIANGIVRLNSDGSLDTSFNIGNGVDTAGTEVVRSIAIQPDGKLLIGGLFANFNDVASTRNLVRLNADGSVDTSFATGTGPNNNIEDIQLFDDGKIIITTFRYNEEIIPGRLVKIHTDGSRDTTFNASDITSGSTEVIKILDNGQLLVGGTYSTQGKLLKLNADGSLDNSFLSADVDGGGSRIHDLALQADGKIIIAGNFQNIGTRIIRGVARLNNDGTYDGTFNPPTTDPDAETYAGTDDFTNTVNTLELRDSGQLITGGDFRSYNTEPKSPLIALFAGMPDTSEPTFISIPDPNFEQALIDQNIDSDGVINGQMLQTDALGVTSLILNNLNISNLTGVEAFVDLEILTAVNNNLTALNITQNTALTSIILTLNNLTTLDVSNNVNLGTLNLSNNAISTLDLANNTALTILNLQNNTVLSIDTSTLLNLSELVVAQNSITELDVSQNPNLIQIVCSQNDLTELNVKNGNNTAISGTFFDASNNPNLTCIQVDDVDYSTANWFLFDSQSEFLVDCNAVFVNIPDPNFEQALIDQNIDSDGIINGQVLQSDIMDIEFLNVSANSISDLTGIEDFTALETLFASGNNLTTLDISNNLNLNGLYVGMNALTSIDISNNISLVALALAENQLTSIDVSNNLLLTQLFLQDNQLTSIDLTNLEDLVQINLSQNNLNELDLSQNFLLTQIYCSDNDLYNLNVQNGNNSAVIDADFNASLNENLSCITVDNFNYSNTNWNNRDAQSSFSLDCAPDNDDCFDAANVNLGDLVNGSTFSSTSSGSLPSCQEDNIVLLDVWYQFTAPASGAITAVAGSILNSLPINIAIYEDCNAVEPISCDAGTVAISNLVAGQTYYIQIWIGGDVTARNSTIFADEFSLEVQDSSTLSVANVQLDENSVVLSPNPASNQTIITSRNVVIDRIEIFDITGKRVSVLNQINSKNQTINTSEFATGMYLIQINSNNSTLIKKLLIK